MAVEKKFNIGDIVSLKSGGPNMTVRNYQNKNGVTTATTTTVLCEWFDNAGKVQREIFHQDTLEADKKPK